MLALLSIAGRLLGPDEYGVFMWAIGLATVAEVFMDFGLHQVTIRGIAKDPAQAGPVFRTSLWLKALPAVGMVVVFGGVAVWLRDDPVVRLASLIMLGSAVMRSYVLTARGVLQGLERFGADALVTVLDRALLLLACGWALCLGASVIQVSLVFLAARVASTLVALAIAARLVGAVTGPPPVWRTLVAEALPVGLFLLVLNLYNRVDTLMLGVMQGDRATGLYNTAYPIYEGLTYASAIITAVLVPRLSRLWASDQHAYRVLARRSLIGTAALAVLVAAAAWPLAGVAIRIFFGSDYLEAVPALQWLLAGLPFIYVIWVLHTVALSAHRTDVLLKVTAAGTVLNVGLNLLLIPGYSYTGAAIATVISEVVAMLLLLAALGGTLSGPSSPTPVSDASTDA
jgi:O-antigen/teichoic acid export membrane protein